MYRIEIGSVGDCTVQKFDTAEEAMTAANRLRVRRVSKLVIKNEAGEILTDEQLAMIVMEARLACGEGRR